MSWLVLIDGNAILHRAYHALPPSLTNKNGEPTNAVYGFVGMLLRVIEDLKPTHLAVAFDRPAPTFRKKMYSPYQAQRPDMEDTLVSQVSKIHHVVKSMGIASYGLDGYEADDVMGTIANKVVKSGNSHAELVSASKSKKIPKQVRDDISYLDEVVIVTGDRDLLQLVNKKVKLYMPVKGLSDAKLFGEKEAEERMGVPPSQIADLKGLMGDPSDNYPGVSGIGPKTAVSLLQQFGSVENLYTHLDQVANPSVRDKLLKDKDNALLSFKLATVVTDVPVEFDTEKMKLPDDFLTQEVIEAFGNLGFRTLLRRLTDLNRKVHGVKETKIEVKKDDSEQMGMF